MSNPSSQEEPKQKNAIMRLVDKVMELYDRAMKRMLEIGWLKSYYDDPAEFVLIAAKKYFKLNQEQIDRVMVSGFDAVASDEEIKRVAKKIIHKRAFRAGVATFFCSLPQNWVMWPLLVVDIVYFQKEVFLMTQELEILYGKKEQGHDYTKLAATAVKLEGTLLRHKVAGYAKRGVGKGLRMGLEYGTKVFRGSLQVALRQLAKWSGIVASHNFINLAIDVLLYLITSAIAGFVSYWLFVPMGWRLLKQLSAKPEGTAEEPVPAENAQQPAESN